MFSSTLGRGRFFLYSAALVVAEIFATILCISATLGIKGLAESRPGAAREPLAIAILIVSVILWLARSNFAWRRSRDAQGSKWIVGSYIVFSAFFVLLQSATFLVFDFGGENSNVGLNILGLVILGLWFSLLFARPAGGSWDADSFAASVDNEVRARVGGGAGVEIASATPAAATPRSAPPPRAVASGRPAGFGKRGLA